MKTTILISVAILASTAAAAQETYKCKTPGGMVYQDRPCAGVRYAPSAAPVVTPLPAAGVAPVPVAVADQAPSDLERQRAYLASQEKSRRVAAVKDEIEELENLMASSQRQRDSELERLSARKARAYNNLAGATLEHGLATEMQAVNERYAADATIRNDRLRHLRDELTRLR